MRKCHKPIFGASESAPCRIIDELLDDVIYFQFNPFRRLGGSNRLRTESAHSCWGDVPIAQVETRRVRTHRTRQTRGHRKRKERAIRVRNMAAYFELMGLI